MVRPISRILVVGGGTAGWLSAAYLNRALSAEVEITLIESSSVGTVGVGEATIPTLRLTFDFLGMDEDEWMPRCNATFKTAIRFENWTAPPPSREGFYHPFFGRRDLLAKPYGVPYFPDFGEGFALTHFWLQRRLAGDPEPLAYALSEIPSLCDLKRAPRTLDSLRHEVVTAYHLDAGLLASYLRDLATSRGVRHVVDHVVGVVRADDGRIRHLETESGTALQADLFLDCTGFRGRLINQALEEPFLSDAESLFCDAAVAIPARNHPARDGIRPFTLATALRAGWVWDVPLYHRNGCGYVYCSRFASREQAEDELRAFLGDRSTGVEARHIRMRIGRTRRAWVENCVAIGLSSCFLEPLESTGIFLIEYQLQSLVTHFPDQRFSSGLRDAYNRVIQHIYEELRDFIVLHYVASGRRDTPFWREVHDATVIPGSLQARLDTFRDALPVHSALAPRSFPNSSWACILAGLEHLPQTPYPILAHIDASAAQAELAAVKKRTAELCERLPDQFELLSQLHYRHAESPYPD